MGILKNLFELGSHHAKSYETARKIVLSNQLTATFVGVSAPYVLIFPLLGSTFLGGLVLLVELTFGLTWVLNWKGYNRQARIWLVCWINFWVFVFCYFVGQGSGIQNILFTLIPVSFALLGGEKKVLPIFIGLPLGLFYVLEMLKNSPYFRIPFTPQAVSIVYYTGTGFIFCILVLSIRFYSKVLQKSQSTLDTVLRSYPLTQREVEIVQELSLGKDNKAISAALFIEEATVKNHLKNIYQKLQVKSRAELLSQLLKKFSAT